MKQAEEIERNRVTYVLGDNDVMEGNCPMRWKKVELQSLAEIVSGATPKTTIDAYWGGEIEWATPKDLSKMSSKYICATPKKLTQSGLDSCSAKLLPIGSVLFSSRAPIGHVAINKVPMCTNQGFKSFVPDSNKISSDYLYWWLKSQTDYLQSLGNGATFKEVSKATVAQIQIPLPFKNGKPDLDEQKRIAAILDKADAIRRKRRQALQLTDDFLRSLFLDMFGDPVTNPMGWDTKALKELGRISTGSTPPSKLDAMFDGEIPFATPGDLKETWIETKRTVTQAGAKKSRTVEAGATIVCCIGATIGKMGKAVQMTAFNQQLNAIEWYDEVTCDFGLEMMKFYKSKIAKDGASTTLPILKKSRFEEIRVLHPPVELQEEFSSLVRHQEMLKNKLHSGLKDALFASLQKSAFQGEL